MSKKITTQARFEELKQIVIITKKKLEDSGTYNERKFIGVLQSALAVFGDSASKTTLRTVIESPTFADYQKITKERQVKMRGGEVRNLFSGVIDTVKKSKLVKQFKDQEAMQRSGITVYHSQAIMDKLEAIEELLKQVAGAVEKK